MKKVLMTLAIMTMGIGCLAAEMECVQLWKGGPLWAINATTVGIVNVHGDGDNASTSGDYYPWGSTLGFAQIWDSRKQNYNYWASTDAAQSMTGRTLSAGNGCSNQTYKKNTSENPKALLDAGYTILDGSGTEVLAPAYDAATQALGPGWRMPTKKDFEDLVANCACVYENSGLKFTGRGKYADKSILIKTTPGRGYSTGRTDTSISYYWTSTPDIESGTKSYMFVFNNGQANPRIESADRYYGARIFPVRDPPPPKGVTIMIR